MSRQKSEVVVLRYQGKLFLPTEDAPKGIDPVDVDITEPSGKLKHCLNASLMPLRRYTLANPDDLSKIYATVYGARDRPSEPIELLLYGHHFISNPSVPRGKVRFTHDRTHHVGPTDFKNDASFIYAYRCDSNRLVRKCFGWIKPFWSRIRKLFSRPRPDFFDDYVERKLRELEAKDRADAS